MGSPTISHQIEFSSSHGHRIPLDSRVEYRVSRVSRVSRGRVRIRDVRIRLKFSFSGAKVHSLYTACLLGVQQ